VKPKAHGALNLDAATQGLPHLEHFVLFSSAVSSIGNEGVLLPRLHY
jgi:fatty acid synthase